MVTTMDVMVIFAIVIAFIVKGLCGFANTLVFGSIMSYTSNTINITPIDLLMGYPSNMIIVWKERHSISAKVYVPLSMLVMIGIIPGALFLKVGDTGLIKVLFGIIVILIGIESFLRERQKVKKESSKTFLLLVGIVSGILCGLFGVGAFLVAYISRTTENQNQFRGNICVVFFVENTFRIILYSMTGILTFDIFKENLILYPFMIVGLGIGFLLSKVISEVMVKKIVIILLMISGVTLILNNLF